MDVRIYKGMYAVFYFLKEIKIISANRYHKSYAK